MLEEHKAGCSNTGWCFPNDAHARRPANRYVQRDLWSWRFLKSFVGLAGKQDSHNAALSFGLVILCARPIWSQPGNGFSKLEFHAPPGLLVRLVRRARTRRSRGLG